MKKIFGAVMSAAAMIVVSMVVHAADFDGSKPLICATTEAHDCEPGELCKRSLPQSVRAPQFMRFDFAKQTVAGAKRTSPIRSMEKSKDLVILHGTELDVGWSIAIDAESGELTASYVGRGTPVIIFGACTPQ